MDGQIFLTVDEVAKRFGVNPTTVYRLVQQGAIPGFKIGNQWRFSEDMLKAWVSNQVALEQIKRDEDQRKRA